MGIRFQCHHCGHSLHVKDFQGGKRGRCPECKGAFRIPTSSAQTSLSLEEAVDPVSHDSLAGENHKNSKSANANLFQPKSSSSQLSDHSKQNSETSAAGLLDSPECEIEQIAQPPLSISEAPNARWYVRPTAGGQYGPAPADIVWQWLQEDRIGIDSLVWREDWPEWKVANEIFGQYFQAIGLGSVGSNPTQTNNLHQSVSSATNAFDEALQQNVPAPGTAFPSGPEIPNAMYPPGPPTTHPAYPSPISGSELGSIPQQGYPPPGFAPTDYMQAGVQHASGHQPGYLPPTDSHAPAGYPIQPSLPGFQSAPFPAGVNPATQAIAMGASPTAQSNSTVGRSREQRLKNRKTKYSLIIAVLVFVLIASAIGLVYVLTR